MHGIDILISGYLAIWAPKGIMGQHNLRTIFGFYFIPRPIPSTLALDRSRVKKQKLSSLKKSMIPARYTRRFKTACRPKPVLLVKNWLNNLLLAFFERP